MATTVVLSPHLDDAVFSCGGLLASSARAGRPADVVTLFAGRPPEGEALPDLAQLMHFAMGSPTDPVGLRRGEDEAALRIVGARAVHLDFPSAAYRSAAHPILQRSGRLPVERAASEIALPGRIAAEIVGRYPDPAAVGLVAPLGIGGHVDHLLVREAGSLLLERGYDVVWFEDFPYASDVAAVAVALEAAGPVDPIDVALSDEDIEARATAMSCYRSQVRLIFRALDHDADLVPQFRALVAAAAAGPAGGLRERHYRPRRS